ncbi:outer membrane lipoprotein-sorting protein [Spirochaetia bacterium 38H-sp]|uniref:Outer membrane lipoprotein-sorting protein n=1 Tax=Rarispira pelagica TaxID=3141764 RepID=A0ABU9UA43_9SPIR
MKHKNIFYFALFFIASFSVAAITPQDILEKMEENQTFSTYKAKGKMIIEDRFGKREKTFIVYARGEGETLLEFTSLDEEGQKILRTKDEIYLYYPDAEELIRLQGSALRDSIAGSDISYEDLTGGKDLLDKFNATIEGEEEYNGRTCYILSLKAKKNNVAYPMQKILVDKERFVGLKAQYFALSGKLLKEVEIKEIKEIKGHYIPTHYIFRDVLKKESSTEFFSSDIEVDIKLDDDLFSLEELTW